MLRFPAAFAVQRLFIWELGVMPYRLVALRIAASWPLPIWAGDAGNDIFVFSLLEGEGPIGSDTITDFKVGVSGGEMDKIMLVGGPYDDFDDLLNDDAIVEDGAPPRSLSAVASSRWMSPA